MTRGGGLPVALGTDVIQLQGSSICLRSAQLSLERAPQTLP